MKPMADVDFRAVMQGIEQRIRELESVADPRLRDISRSLVQSLLEVHAEGLRKLLGLMSVAGECGDRVRAQCLEDDLLRNLLLLHDLHPVDVESRVRQALAQVRPYLQSHGGDVELVAIAPDAVRLRLSGSCHGCMASAETLKSRIEAAICELAPDVETIEVVDAPDHAPQIPLSARALPILNNVN